MPFSFNLPTNMLYAIIEIYTPIINTKGCCFSMRIIFVRHGHPNYALDCLTELGHVHATAAAERLKDEGICEIHTSTCGRASETAQHTAHLLGLDIIPHDFMREISWGANDGSVLIHNGHPWYTADEMVGHGKDLTRTDWQITEPFCKNKVVDCVRHVEESFDGWLKTLGYTREGLYYRVTGRDTCRTIAMFSHGGSSSAALAHMFNLPFPYLCEIMQPDFTSITIVTLADEPGALISPRFEILNDCRHIQSGKPIISN